jgi:hypothetical protein
MARPDYLICLECESEVEDFTWRDGEVRRVTCEVCGNTDTDAFSLPEDYDQGVADEDEDATEEEDELEDEEDEYPDDYEDDEEEEEE